MMLGVESKWIESLWPLACSNGGPSSFIRLVREPPAMTRSSAAFAVVAGSRARADIKADIKAASVSDGIGMICSSFWRAWP